MKHSLSSFLGLAFDRRMFYLRSWRIQMSMVVENPIKKPYYPYRIDGVFHFKDQDGEEHEITTPEKDGPLAMWKTQFTLNPEHLPGVDEKIKTQYGLWLVNSIGWLVAYGDKTKYINEPLDPGKLKAKYTEIYESGIVDDNQVFIDSLSDLETLFSSDCEFGVKSSSRTMMLEDKEGEKLREKLLAEYGDRIEDPVVQAEFDTKMIEHKKKLVATTSAKDYYGKGGKMYGTVLMKTAVRFGTERDTAGNETKFIAKPLKKGLDMDNMESWVSAAIAGSHSRGALTALSGADVKELLRALAAQLVSNKKDCGTKTGQVVRVSKENAKLLEGTYELGKETDGLLKRDRILAHIGKTLTVRAPSECIMPPDLYCQTCMGRSTTANGIPGGCSELDSRMMNIQMKAAHGYSKESRKIDLDVHVS